MASSLELRFWRICRARRAKTAFDGEGARLSPGRWNHRGVPVVYCGSSLSLATLEYLVHVDPDELPDRLVAIHAGLPAAVAVESLDPPCLPSGWRAYPAPAATKDLGSKWASSLRSVALLVPSAITPNERNVILNPRHRDFGRLTRERPQPFAFERRLFRKQ